MHRPQAKALSHPVGRGVVPTVWNISASADQHPSHLAFLVHPWATANDSHNSKWLSLRIDNGLLLLLLLLFSKFTLKKNSRTQRQRLLLRVLKCWQEKPKNTIRLMFINSLGQFWGVWWGGGILIAKGKDWQLFSILGWLSLLASLWKKTQD